MLYNKVNVDQFRSTRLERMGHVWRADDEENRKRRIGRYESTGKITPKMDGQTYERPRWNSWDHERYTETYHKIEEDGKIKFQQLKF